MDVGLDCRASSGYVTDPANCYFLPFSAFSANYPQTIGGTNVGYDLQAGSGNGPDGRDRSTSNDHRLGGIQFSQDPNTKTRIRIDLDAAGTFNIDIALGDNGGGPGYAYMAIEDNGSALGAALVNTSVGYSADEYYDANNTKHASSAAWASNHVTVAKTFSSTIAQFVIQPGGAVASFTRLAHIRITSAGGAPAGQPTIRRYGGFPFITKFGGPGVSIWGILLFSLLSKFAQRGMALHGQQHDAF